MINKILKIYIFITFIFLLSSCTKNFNEKQIKKAFINDQQVNINIDNIELEKIGIYNNCLVGIISNINKKGELTFSKIDNINFSYYTQQPICVFKKTFFGMLKCKTLAEAYESRWINNKDLQQIYNSYSQPGYIDQYFKYKINETYNGYILYEITNNELDYVEIPQYVNEIPVVQIDEYTFKSLNNLKEIKIPNSVKKISLNAFLNCKNLTKIYYKGSIENWCQINFENEFANPMKYADNIYILNEQNIYEELTNLTIPNTITKIGDYQFLGFENIKELTFSKNTITIGKDAFSDCTSVLDIYYDGNIENWCQINFENLFSNPMRNAKNIYMLNEQNQYEELTNLTIPNTITKIGDYQFLGFENIKELTFSKNTITIGKDAFYGCSDLSKVYYNGDIENWCNIIFYEAESNPMKYADNIYMLNEQNQYEELTNLTIPNTIIKIGDYQFLGFENIKELTFSKNIITTGKDAFYGCSDLSKVYYNGDIENWCNIIFYEAESNPMRNAKNIYMLNEQNQYEELTNLTIPNTITKIGDYQFLGFKNIKSIIIPSNIISVGKDAFYLCQKLIYNEDNVGYYLGNDENKYLILAKVKDSTITSYEINEKTKIIGSSAFSECVNLETIIIPNNIVSIAAYAFSHCIELKKIVISESVISVGQYAFLGCIKLNYNKYKQGYYLGNEENKYLIYIESIGNYHASYEINEKTKIIADNAFMNCTNLEYITVPESVISIGNFAFSGCTNLTNIKIPTSVIYMGVCVFDKCNEKIAIHR